ncbi:MAG TPA: hypothetical protein EYP14_01820 [Planctomycetaceae bacterium]|nr:hypothetical protein [Planctomycetaceae bacterium]
MDAPVLRDADADDDPQTGNLGKPSSGLDQRLYYLGDANFNVTCLVDTAGDATERYLYAPYGIVTIYDPIWSSTRSTTSYDNATIYGGRELDGETRLCSDRNRYYDSGLGRFLSTDEIRYQGDVSPYEYVESRPIVYGDPMGLQPRPGHDTWSPDECVRALVALKKRYEQGRISLEEYQRGIEQIGTHCREIIPPPAEDSTPPKRPDCCSGKNCTWDAAWTIRAARFGWLLGLAKSTFSATGKDDTGCVYYVHGRGFGAIGGIFTGWPSTKFQETEYPAVCEWPIRLGSDIYSVTVGISVGPLTLGYNRGSAGGFSSWYIGGLGGFRITVGGVEMRTTVTEIHYSITVPAP